MRCLHELMLLTDSNGPIGFSAPAVAEPAAAAETGAIQRVPSCSGWRRDTDYRTCVAAQRRHAGRSPVQPGRASNLGSVKYEDFECCDASNPALAAASRASTQKPGSPCYRVRLQPLIAPPPFIPCVPTRGILACPDWKCFRYCRPSVPKGPVDPGLIRS